MKGRVPAFVAVGAIGFLLQLGSLAFLTMVAGWPYGPATASAVQLAVIHNFLWHERWTWRDRTIPLAAGPQPGSTFDRLSSTPSFVEGSVSDCVRLSRDGAIARFARYQITTGATSIVGNLLCTLMLVEMMGIPVLAANVAAVMAMSIANFLVSDRWVFAQRAVGVAAALAIVSASPASGAEPKPDTVAAWNRYVADTEARLAPDRSADIRNDQPEGRAIGVPGGTIHDWRSSLLIHGVTVDAVVHALMNPGTPPPQEDVLESRVLRRSNDSLCVYLKLVRRTIITVTYDTEHQVTFHRHGPGLATSRSVSTRIVEADGRDRGFLWRLNSYWRYMQVGDAVRVEVQSVSLSRDVPALLKPVAAPIVNRIARESLAKTLEALRAFFERN